MRSLLPAAAVARGAWRGVFWRTACILRWPGIVGILVPRAWNRHPTLGREQVAASLQGWHGGHATGWVASAAAQVGHRGKVLSTMFSSDGSLVATGDSMGVIRVIDVAASCANAPAVTTSTPAPLSKSLVRLGLPQPSSTLVIS